MKQILNNMPVGATATVDEIKAEIYDDFFLIGGHSSQENPDWSTPERMEEAIRLIRAYEREWNFKYHNEEENEEVDDTDLMAAIHDVLTEGPSFAVEDWLRARVEDLVSQDYYDLTMKLYGGKV